MKFAAAPVAHHGLPASNCDAADPVSPYERGLRTAFEHAISGIALLNGRGCILDCNAAMSTMLARPIVELADTYIGDLVIADDRVAIDLALLELRQGATSTVRLSPPRHPSRCRTSTARLWERPGLASLCCSRT